MDTLTVKVHEYNEENHSLVVSFTTDASDMSVDESEKYSFDIHNYNPNDLSDALAQIAKQGAVIAHQKYLKEQSKKNEDVVTAAKSEIGKVYNFPIADLINVTTYTSPDGDTGNMTGITIL
jgi:hypothetical protein